MATISSLSQTVSMLSCAAQSTGKSHQEVSGMSKGSLNDHNDQSVSHDGYSKSNENKTMPALSLGNPGTAYAYPKTDRSQSFVYRDAVKPIFPIIFQRTKATCLAYGKQSRGNKGRVGFPGGSDCGPLRVSFKDPIRTAVARTGARSTGAAALLLRWLDVLIRPERVSWSGCTARAASEAPLVLLLLWGCFSG
ncbi:hypothetical protein C2845_PM07G13300 [Panicum miliaceum]|uniref:Uncharacterized protein n=1 Tax=Panicum miliaceum TaxID=4540 RepID=A0A3L6SQI6_PANMI|nr:hypothetical protein C2845_PM07G13300 [Panicum miliaceum]